MTEVHDKPWTMVHGTFCKNVLRFSYRIGRFLDISIESNPLYHQMPLVCQAHRHVSHYPPYSNPSNHSNETEALHVESKVFSRTSKLQK